MSRKDDQEPAITEITGATAWPFERKCPECGKVFAGTFYEDWVYRDRGELLCSWRCKRKREQDRTRQELQRRERQRQLNLKPNQKQEIIRGYVNQGMSNKAISAITGFSLQLVNHYRKKIREEDTGVFDDGGERDRQGVQDVSAAEGGRSGREG